MSLDSDRRLPDGARAEFLALPGLEEFKLAALWLPDELLEHCERAIGLDNQDQEFRCSIADAVLIASIVHKLPRERMSALSKELAQVQKHARAAATELEQLADKLCFSSKGKFQQLMRDLMIPELLELANFVERVSAKYKDRGGPNKMVGFSILIRFLADAFGRAAGHRAGITWAEHRNRYEGQFWDLIESVLPEAISYAGDRFAPVTPNARGRQVQRILTAMDKTRRATG